MSRKTFSLIGICAALAAMPAHACMRATPEEAVKALDTDKNGSVSFKEYFADWTKRAEDNIKMLDSGREFSEKYEQGFDYEKQKKQFQDWGKQENAKRCRCERQLRC